jgi:hypothetical protein
MYAEEQTEGPPPLVTLDELPTLFEEVTRRNWTSSPPAHEEQITINSLVFRLLFLKLNSSLTLLQ